MKKESREEANEDSEEQDVTEAGRVFQRIEQKGRKEDRWPEVEQKGTSIDFGFRRLYLQREDAFRLETAHALSPANRCL